MIWARTSPTSARAPAMIRYNPAHDAPAATSAVTPAATPAAAPAATQGPVAPVERAARSTHRGMSPLRSQEAHSMDAAPRSPARDLAPNLGLHRLPDDRGARGVRVGLATAGRRQLLPASARATD